MRRREPFTPWIKSLTVLFVVLATGCTSGERGTTGSDAGLTEDRGVSERDDARIAGDPGTAKRDPGTDPGERDPGVDPGQPDPGADPDEPDADTDPGSSDTGADTGTDTGGTDPGSEVGEVDPGNDPGQPDPGGDPGEPDPGTDTVTDHGTDTATGADTATDTPTDTAIDTETTTDAAIDTGPSDPTPAALRPLPAAFLGRPYDWSLVPDTPPGTEALTVAGGSLPPGLLLRVAPENLGIVGAATETGRFDFVLRYDGPAAPVEIPYTIYASDRWVPHNPWPTGADIYDLWHPPGVEDFVVAVGAAGTILFHDGETWSPTESGTGADLHGVWGTAADDIWAVGDGGVLVHFEGIAWVPVDVDTAADLYDVWALGDLVVAVGDGGAVVERREGAFELAASGTEANLRGVFGVPSGGIVVAVGAGGTIIERSESDWSPMGSGSPADLESVWGTGPDDLVTVGDSTALVYDGTSWSPLGDPGAVPLVGVWGDAADSYRAVDLEGRIHVWDGSTWEAHGSGGDEGYRAIFGNAVYCVGEGGILCACDDPENIACATTSVVEENLRAVHGQNAGEVMAVGYMGKLVVFDGLFWSSSTQTEVTPAELADVWVSPQGAAWAVGPWRTIVGRYSVEEPWRFISGGIPDSEWLHGIWGISEQAVRIVGDEGLIMYRFEDKWITEDSGVTVDLRGIWAPDEDLWFAVGDQGRVLRRLYGLWEVKVAGDFGMWRLNDVHGTSDEDVWAVGEHGLVLHLDDDGWSEVEHGLGTHELRGVWAGDGAVYVVGGEGVILHYDKVAQTWTKQLAGTDADLHGIVAAPETDPATGEATGDTAVFVVGDGGTILHYTTATDGGVLVPPPPKLLLDARFQKPGGGALSAVCSSEELVVRATLNNVGGPGFSSAGTLVLEFPEGLELQEGVEAELPFETKSGSASVEWAVRVVEGFASEQPVPVLVHIGEALLDTATNEPAKLVDDTVELGLTVRERPSVEIVDVHPSAALGPALGIAKPGGFVGVTATVLPMGSKTTGHLRVCAELPQSFAWDDPGCGVTGNQAAECCKEVDTVYELPPWKRFFGLLAPGWPIAEPVEASVHLDLPGPDTPETPPPLKPAQCGGAVESVVDSLPFSVRVAECGPNLGPTEIAVETDKTELLVGEWLDVTLRFKSGDQPVPCYNPIDWLELVAETVNLVSGEISSLELEAPLLSELEEPGKWRFREGTATGVAPPEDDAGAIRFRVRSTAPIGGIRFRTYEQAFPELTVGLSEQLTWAEAPLGGYEISAHGSTDEPVALPLGEQVLLELRALDTEGEPIAFHRPVEPLVLRSVGDEGVWAELIAGPPFVPAGDGALDLPAQSPFSEAGDLQLHAAFSDPYKVPVELVFELRAGEAALATSPPVTWTQAQPAALVLDAPDGEVFTGTGVPVSVTVLDASSQAIPGAPFSGKTLRITALGEGAGAVSIAAEAPASVEPVSPGVADLSAPAFDGEGSLGFVATSTEIAKDISFSVQEVKPGEVLGLYAVSAGAVTWRPHPSELSLSLEVVGTHDGGRICPGGSVEAHATVENTGGPTSGEGVLELALDPPIGWTMMANGAPVGAELPFVAGEEVTWTLVAPEELPESTEIALVVQSPPADAWTGEPAVVSLGTASATFIPPLPGGTVSIKGWTLDPPTGEVGISSTALLEVELEHEGEVGGPMTLCLETVGGEPLTMLDGDCRAATLAEDPETLSWLISTPSFPANSTVGLVLAAPPSHVPCGHDLAVGGVEGFAVELATVECAGVENGAERYVFHGPPTYAAKLKAGDWLDLQIRAQPGPSGGIANYEPIGDLMLEALGTDVQGVSLEVSDQPGVVTALGPGVARISKQVVFDEEGYIGLRVRSTLAGVVAVRVSEPCVGIDGTSGGYNWQPGTLASFEVRASRSTLLVGQRATLEIQPLDAFGNRLRWTVLEEEGTPDSVELVALGGSSSEAFSFYWAGGTQELGAPVTIPKSTDFEYTYGVRFDVSSSVAQGPVAFRVQDPDDPDTGPEGPFKGTSKLVTWRDVPRIAEVGYVDVDDNRAVGAGDELRVLLDAPMSPATAGLLKGAPPSEVFFLGIAGDSLGAGATLSVDGDSGGEILVVTLGAEPKLHVHGTFGGWSDAPGHPSGIDFGRSALMEALTTSPTEGVADHGLIGVHDAGVDIHSAFEDASEERWPDAKDDDNRALLAGDFDGDRRPDVVRVRPDGVDLYRADPGSPGHLLLAAEIIPMPEEVVATTAVVTDFGSDGYDDLLVGVQVGAGTAEEDRRLRMLAGGPGGLGDVSESSTPGIPLPGGDKDSVTNHLLVVDFNRDGAPDVFACRGTLSSNEQIRLLLGDTCLDGVLRDSGDNHGVESYSAVLPLDVERDGRLDFVRLGFGSQTWNKLLRHTAEGTFEAHDVPGLHPHRETETGEVCDLDGDSREDLVVAYAGPNPEGQRALSVSLNATPEQTGFEAAQELESRAGVEIRALACADLDGDGAPELVVGGHEPAGEGQTKAFARVYGNVGGTLVLTASLPVKPAAGTVQTLAVSDLDGDGDNDLLVGLDSGRPRYLENRSPSLSPKLVVDEGVLPAVVDGVVGAVVADLDRDGHPDLLVARDDGDAEALRWSPTSGSFEAEALPAASDCPWGTPSAASRLRAADVDGDADVDAVLLGVDGSLRLLAGDGDGQMEDVTCDSLASLSAESTSDLALADLDGDGRAELLRLTEGSEELEVRSFGTSGLEEPESFNALLQPLSNPTAYDVDFDGDLDVLGVGPGIIALRHQRPSPEIYDLDMDPDDDLGGASVYDVWGAGPSEIFAVAYVPGSDDVVLRFDGTEWAVDPAAATLGYFESARIDGAHAGDVWVVGTSTGGALVGRLSSDTWSALDHPAIDAESYFGDVWVSGPTGEGGTVMIVGHGGVVLRWVGGELQEGPNVDQLHPGDSLLEVWGQSADEVYAASNAGLIARFDGAGWAVEKEADDYVHGITALWGRPGAVWAAAKSGKIYARDGGEWKNVYYVGYEDVRGAWAAGPGWSFLATAGSKPWPEVGTRGAVASWRPPDIEICYPGVEALNAGWGTWHEGSPLFVAGGEDAMVHVGGGARFDGSYGSPIGEPRPDSMHVLRGGFGKPRRVFVAAANGDVDAIILDGGEIQLQTHTGTVSRAAGAADFDLDGDDDLALVSDGAAPVFSLKGTSGDQGSEIALEGAHVAVAPLDMDRDGDLDVFLAGGEATPSVVLRNDAIVERHALVEEGAWTQVHGVSQSIRRLSWTPRGIYAATSDGILASCDQGNTWAALDDDGAPVDVRHVVAGTSGDGLRLVAAHAGGIAWTSLHKCPPEGTWLAATGAEGAEIADATWELDSHEGPPGAVLIAAGDGGFLASFDGGTAWQAAAELPVGERALGVRFDHATGAAFARTASRSIRRTPASPSADEPPPAASPVVSPQGSVEVAAFAVTGPGELLVVETTGILWRAHMSSATESTWTELGPGPTASHLAWLRADHVDPRVLYAYRNTVDHDPLWVSRDGGESWEATDDWGLNLWGDMHDLLQDPTKPERFWLAMTKPSAGKLIYRRITGIAMP